MQLRDDLSNHVVRNGGKFALAIAFLAYNLFLKYLAIQNDLGFKRKEDNIKSRRKMKNHII